MRSVRAFASNIISPFHQVGVLAFLRAYSYEERPVKAQIMTAQGNWKRLLIDQGRLDGQSLTVEIVDKRPRVKVSSLCKALYALLFWRKRSFPSCLVIGHSRVNLKLLAHLIDQGVVNRNDSFATVVIDEGIGTYGKFRYRYKVFCRENKPVLLQRLLYMLVYPVNQIFLKWSVLIDFDWRLFKKRNGKYIGSGDPVNEYRNYFLENAHNVVLPFSSKTVIILTQPLVELNMVSEEQYHDTLLRLKKCVAEAGAKMVVKLHPAEKKGSYAGLGVDSIESEFIAETIFCAIKPLAVIGFSSTALINSRLFFGIPSISIVYLMPEKLSSRFVFFDDPGVCSIFREFVKFPKNWEELNDHIQRVVS